ncbi:EamA family transporter [Mangrovibacter plantisponsor]|uniref:Multidrug transporter EmrE-like cation transporter n=1 Tax=Mangrovibacter plantisponsor TaxID=451513 RepID=A0A317Q570_9ENTR|nr:EamA family transporter [Mangrovibacter plantisponsor]PWW11558.1 multidrug transporter EmrE-like cation transporter [Mangrovibacter plantisponsor]
MKWVILLFGVLSNASASVLIKYAMIPPRKFPTVNDISSLLNWPFWLGLCLYGLAFILYAASLSRLPLNIVHPILTVGSVAMVALFSSFILKEHFYWTTWVGIIIVILGVSLITARVS